MSHAPWTTETSALDREREASHAKIGYSLRSRRMNLANGQHEKCSFASERDADKPAQEKIKRFSNINHMREEVFPSPISDVQEPNQ
jgi:hypothetical protein